MFLEETADDDQIAKELLIRFANGALVANRQLVASLGAAAGKHSPAVRRFHANSKSMSFGAPAIIGLKSAFWHSRSFFDYLYSVAKRLGCAPAILKLAGSSKAGTHYDHLIRTFIIRWTRLQMDYCAAAGFLAFPSA